MVAQMSLFGGGEWVDDASAPARRDAEITSRPTSTGREGGSTACWRTGRGEPTGLRDRRVTMGEKKRRARCNICGRFGRKDGSLPCVYYDWGTGVWEHE